MADKVVLQFKCKIHRLIDNGFTSLDEKEYLIRFEDKNLHHPFNKDDNILITIENVENVQKEIVADGYLVIFCILKSFLSNGFLFIGANSKNEGFFWTYRGMITHRLFAVNDYFEKNSLLRIMIKKI